MKDRDNFQSVRSYREILIHEKTEDTSILEISLNRIYLRPLEIDNSSIEIRDRYRLDHLRKILRTQVGEQVKVFVLDQGLGRAEVISLDKEHCHLKLIDLSQGESPWFNLLAGMVRPQTLKKILFYGTIMGARKITFFQTGLSERSYFNSSLIENYQQHLLDGLSQSGIYYQRPQVEFLTTPAKLLKFEELGARYLLTKVPGPWPLKEDIIREQVTLALGPERGFTQEEEERFLSAGFLPLNLGPTTMRSEMALVGATTILGMERNSII